MTHFDHRPRRPPAANPAPWWARVLLAAGAACSLALVIAAFLAAVAALGRLQ